MKKRNLYATLAATTLIFAGCGQQTASTEVTTAPAATSTEMATETEKEEVSYEFLHHELTTDFEGNPAIWIYSRVTNTGNESVMANCIAYPALFQNGVELEIATPNMADMEKVEYKKEGKQNARSIRRVGDYCRTVFYSLARRVVSHYYCPAEGGGIDGENNGENCSTVYFWDSSSNKNGMVLHNIYATC